jgi:putative membrane protein
MGTAAHQADDLMAHVSGPPALDHGGESDRISVELSSRRTGMSFQRTRMSADRTLMSVMRTSLSLISFGFTIYQFFKSMQAERLGSATKAPRNFGVALILLGIAMILCGIIFHILFMRGLRDLRSEMAREGLIYAQSKFPASYTLIVALLVLLLGLAAIFSVWFRVGPFE